MRRFDEDSLYYYLLKHLRRKRLQEGSTNIFNDGFGDFFRGKKKGELSKLLKEYHSKFYSTKYSSVVIYGSFTQKQIKNEIIPIFEGIHLKEKNKKKRPRYLRHLSKSIYSKNTKNRFHLMQGTKRESILYLTFQLPSSLRKESYLPLNFISFLLDYQSKKSLKYKLQADNLILDMDDELSA